MYRRRLPVAPLPKQIVPSTWYKWRRGLTNTNLSKDDRTILSEATFEPARDSHHLSGEDAIKLVDYSITYSKQRTTRDLRMYFPYQTQSINITEFLFQVFHDMDEDIFASVLRWNVYLCWSSLPPGLPGKTTRDGSNPRIKIELATSLMQSGSYSDVLEALLHQMVHAFLLQVCDQKQGATRGADPIFGHGKRFNTILRLIMKRFVGARGLDLLRLCRVGYAPVHGPRLRRLSHSLPRKQGSTSCYIPDHEIAQRECIKLYDAMPNKLSPPEIDLLKGIVVGADGIKRPTTQYFWIFDNEGDVPTPRLRCEFKPEPGFVELRMDNYAIPTPPGKLAGSSLNEKLANSRLLEVPTADWKNFSRLLSFIRDGKYGPEIDGRTQPLLGNRNWPSQAITHGPPRIMPKGTTEEDILVSDVQAYRLASAIGFSEMCAYILDRMSSPAYTHDDPCKVLEMVYHSGPPAKPADEPQKGDDMKSPIPPDEKMRTWVQEWLKVSGSGRPYANNLQCLQKHPDWKDKYAKLRERGSEMITDIDAIEAELAKRDVVPQIAKPQAPSSPYYERPWEFTSSSYHPRAGPWPHHAVTEPAATPHGYMAAHEYMPGIGWVVSAGARAENEYRYYGEPHHRDGGFQPNVVVNPEGDQAYVGQNYIRCYYAPA